MVFSSLTFIFVFLPLALALYYAVPFRAKTLVILIASYVFYAWWRVDFLILIAAMSVFTYGMAHIALNAPRESQRRLALTAGIVVDLGLLGYFKYAMFFGGNLSVLSQGITGQGFDIPDIILPIGISFHTFQSISYLIDIYRKDARPARTVFDFMAFGALFPQLIAGPVLRYKDIADQFEYREHTYELFARGIYRFALGLGMKVLIADSVAPIADAVFGMSAPTMAESWLGTAAYSIQLLFDFMGYSSMAIGLGLMMGFRIMENFDAPYRSRSITEFWRRWHISLSSWLRDYLYIPLGGNRKGPRRTYINLMLTMILGGLWHGAAWTFILWGLWHGGLLALERALGWQNGKSLLRWGMTLVLVMLGWTLFRAVTLPDALAMYAGMIGLNGLSLTADVAWQITPLALTMLVVGWTLALTPVKEIFAAAQQRAVMRNAIATTLFVVAVSRLAASSYSPFLYFQF